MAQAQANLMTGGRSVILTVEGASISAPVLDTAKAGRRSAVLAFTVNGQAVRVLLRHQRSADVDYLDLVVDESIGALSTRVAALNLTGRNEANAKDYIDASALVAAGGS
jgi:hypothetical protein